MKAFMSRFIPDNQNFVVCAQKTQEQYAAEDYLLKNAIKLDAKQCADYCRYFFANILVRRLIKKDTLLFFVEKSEGLSSIGFGFGWLLKIQFGINQKMAIKRSINLTQIYLR